MDRPGYPETAVSRRREPINFAVNRLQLRAADLWTNFAHIYGLASSGAPAEYLEKYVNEVRVYGEHIADARIRTFTRMIMLSAFVRALLPGGFVRIESRVRGGLVADIKREIMDPALQYYARRGLIVLVLCQYPPAVEGDAGLYIDVIRGVLHSHDDEDQITPADYSFTSTPVVLIAIEQYLEGDVRPSEWVLGDSGNVRRVSALLPE